MYAVFDLETTGFSPKLNHRAAEIAVVLVDEHGRIEHEWSTLLNPERDLGPQHIHRIQARDVVDAPCFADVTGHLVDLLRGRALVAHNLPFDVTFLAAEFERSGVAAPVTPDIGLCTMALSSSLLPGAGRNLKECCRAANIPLTGWHAALSDAQATARLLAHYLDLTGQPPPWRDALQRARQVQWPRVEQHEFTAKTRTRTQVDAASKTIVSHAVDFMPRVDSSDLADPYLAVLDQALSDRYLSSDESAALLALATSLGLTSDDVRALHNDYLYALARVALSDSELSKEEAADLEQVSTILGLPKGTADAAVSAAARTAGPVRELPIKPGDMIVFTGDMAEPRELWIQRATHHGFVPHPRVTKKVKLVVAADVDSLSSKARRARGYNIPIMRVDEFRKALGYTEVDRVPGQRLRSADGTGLRSVRRDAFPHQ